MSTNDSVVDHGQVFNFNLSDEYAAMMAVKEDMMRASRTFEIVIPVVIGIVLIIGLLGNAMVICVTVMTQRIIKHPVHSMLVLNLAVADIMYLVCNAPYYMVTNISHQWSFTEEFCPFFHFASNVSMAAGIFTMCSLGWMRFMALMHPFKFQKSVLPTRTGGIAVIVLTWVAAFIIALPNAVHYRLVTVSERSQCVWADKTSERVYVMVLLLFTYVVPFFLVTVFYILIGREILCFMMRKTQRAGPAGGEQQTKKEYRKTTFMVLFLIVAFLVCWFPHNLYIVIVMTKNYSSYRYGVMRYILKMVGRCMSYAHACVNPIIYTFASSDFRVSLCHSLTGPCRRASSADKVDACAVRNTGTGKQRRCGPEMKMMLPDCERTLVSKISSPISPRHSSLKYNDGAV